MDVNLMLGAYDRRGADVPTDCLPTNHGTCFNLQVAAMRAYSVTYRLACRPPFNLPELIR